MPSNEDAYWVDVLPAMDKILPAMRKALPGLMKSAGGQAGSDFSDSFTRTTVSAVEKASTQLAAARKKDAAAAAAAEAASKKEADAAGRVTVARAKLAELVDKGTASTAQLAAANERLASAQRGLDTATSGLTRAQQAQEDTADGVTRATRLLSDAQSKAETGNDNLSRSMRDSDKAGDTATRGFEKVKGSVSGLVALLGAGATAVAGFWDAVGAEKGTSRLAAQLGLDPAEAQRAGSVAGGLYRDAYGESLEQVNDAVGAVMSSLDGMRDASDTDLRAATANALNFASAFSVDVNEAVSSAGILIKSGLAADATEAFDLMTAALQQVPAALRPAVLEATDEYAQFFSSLGYSGEQTMALIVDAAAKGQFGIDKIGDSVKEFTIRSTDMSASSKAAYEAIGLDAETMANRILAGGESAQTATQDIVTGLLSMTDPAAQANAAIALFGTPLEDLNVTEIPAFLESLTMTNGEMENVAGTAAAMGDTLNNNTATRIEELKRTTMGFVQDGIVALADGFTTGKSTATGWQGTLQSVGAVAKDVFGYVRDTAVPALKDAGTWISNNSAWLLPLVGALGAGYVAFQAITGAVSAFRTAQAALNIVMNANPFVLIATLIAALVTGLVIAYQKSETFREIVDGVFRAVGAAATWLWSNVLAPVFGWIGDAWSGLATGFQWVWNTLLSPVFTWFGDTLTRIKDGFTTAVDWIGRTWEGLKDKLMVPVQWVVDFVWNDGLRKLWNTINNLWDGNDIDPFRLASGGVIPGAGTSGAGGTTRRLATGGVLPGYTPGRDVHIFNSPTGGRLELSGGEAVMRPEFTAALGVPTINLLNALAAREGATGVRAALSGPMPATADQARHYAGGGVISLPGWLTTTLSAATGGGAITAALNEIVDRVNGGSGWGLGAWADALIGTAKQAGTKLWDAASDLLTGDDAIGHLRPLGGAVTPAGGSSVWERAFNTVKAAFPQARLNSAYRPGDPGFHGSGEAVDLGWMLAPGGTGNPYMASMKTWLHDHFRGSRELIYNGSGMAVPNLKNGVPLAYSAAIQAQHRNHVHWVPPTGFDSGGLWEDGVVGYNATGDVERVLTPPQDDTFQRFTDVGGRLLEQAAPVVLVRNYFGNEEMTDLIDTRIELLGEDQDDERRAVLAAAGLI